jgi:formate dehydrogenase major subunit
VIGANPTDAHPVFASRMKRRLREGAQLIVIDPRRIDLVRTPHVEADFHLQLKPGTNVAVLNALAHVIVTEGLAKEDYVRERCDPPSTRSGGVHRAAEELARGAGGDTGVPAAADPRRGAALRDGAQRRDLLRPRRHRAQPGQHDRDGDRQPRDGHRQHRPPRRRREPAARPEQRAGQLRHGLVPARAARLPPRLRRGVRALFEAAWGVPIDAEPGLRIPNMFDAAIDGSFKALYVQGEDIAQSDPDTQHVQKALESMECLIVQDIFLNETAKYAHVLLPGSSFLEKDGTFTNAERRISRVRKVMPPLAGLADWEVTWRSPNALGYPMHYDHPSEIMAEIARAHADLHRRQLREARRLGSIQWPCNDAGARRHADHARAQFVRGKGASS